MLGELIMEEKEETWKFYSASIEALNEKIFEVEKNYATSLNTVMNLKEKLTVLNEYVEVKEGEYYVDVQQATDDLGKPLYKNEELRKIEVKDRLRGVPQYQEVKTTEHEIATITAKLELTKLQLEILVQEKEYRIRVGK